MDWLRIAYLATCFIVGFAGNRMGLSLVQSFLYGFIPLSTAYLIIRMMAA